MSELIKKDNSYVWHPFTQHFTEGEPLQIVKAKDEFLYDVNEKQYIDANSSWWVNVHGHGNEEIGNALTKQFTAIDHVVFAGVTHPKAVELAERIVQKLPNNFSKVFFSDNGSTAVEVGLKMALQYFYNKGEKRERFLAMEGAYHGDTFGAMSVGQRGYFNEPFEHFFFDVDFIKFPNQTNESELLNGAEELFKSGEFAGLIVEPLIQGSSGMKMYSALFLDQLTTLARKYGVLVIFDEVMTGFGRTGKMFAMDHCKVKPDIVTLSKGLTGGVMALGLTVATEEIYSAFLSPEKTKALLHGHSFTGNPLACAVSCASLDVFEKEQTWDSIARIQSWNERFLNELRSNDKVAEVRMLGTILALEIETGEGNTYFSNIREKAYSYFLDEGILIRPLGNILFINPPYCIQEESHQKLTGAILRFLASL
jgi:adenosylmethionine-8-amino-7-oxononanoate aminotransferase